jgi:hypothetical protein
MDLICSFVDLFVSNFHFFKTKMMNGKRKHNSNQDNSRPKKKAKKARHVRDANLTKANFKLSLAEAEPEIAALWHPTLNEKVTPNDVGPTSNLKAAFICMESKCPNGCDHTHERIIAKKVKHPKCPWCTAKLRRCCAALSLAANPDFTEHLSKQWNWEKNGDPSSYSPFSSQKVWWSCPQLHGPNCKHEWQADINSRLRGNGCPFCSHCSNAVCCIEVSLANPKYEHILKLFDYEKNDFKPEQVRAHAHKYAHWKCTQGHEFKSMVYNRVNTNAVSCMICDSSTMEKAMESTLKNLNLNFTQQYSLSNNQKVDFMLTFNGQMAAIETDGFYWHFEFNFEPARKNRKADIKKNQWCVENRVPLLRIGYSVKTDDYTVLVQDFLVDVSKQPDKTILRFVGKEYENHFLA